MNDSTTATLTVPAVSAAASPAVEHVAAAPKVTASGVDAWYGDKHVLKNVGLEMGERHITALVGPSGCGKSTFLRSINRMNDLVRGFRLTGTIAVDGSPVYGPGVDLPSLRRRVGMVFQQPNPFPMSIRDNIGLAVKEHAPRLKRAEIDAIVEHSLEQAGLLGEVADSLDRSALGLSGGQQQRLCIARALAVEPDVLMLDEPCASLDPISTARIEELLLRLKERYTVVIVTHNLAQARRIADDTAFFLLGELLESGPTKKMLENPERTETAEYLNGAFG
jgi:phosphate transport system ATP-binding protein